MKHLQNVTSWSDSAWRYEWLVLVSFEGIQQIGYSYRLKTSLRNTICNVKGDLSLKGLHQGPDCHPLPVFFQTAISIKILSSAIWLGFDMLGHTESESICHVFTHDVIHTGRSGMLSPDAHLLYLRSITLVGTPQPKTLRAICHLAVFQRYVQLVRWFTWECSFLVY